MEGFNRHVFIHESIHALFRKSPTSSGCREQKIKSISVRKITGYVKNEIRRFVSDKATRNRMKILSFFSFDRDHTKDFGHALNEGFTEWCTGKCDNGAVAYKPQVKIVEILDCVIGTKGALKIGEGNHNEIAKMLNMNSSEYNSFMAQMDEILLLEHNLDKLEFAFDDNSIALKDETETKKEFACYDLVNKLINRTIYPNLKKNVQPSLNNFIKMARVNNLISEFLDAEHCYEMPSQYKKVRELFKNNLYEVTNYEEFNENNLSFEDCEDIINAMINSECDYADPKIEQIDKKITSIKEKLFSKYKSQLEEICSNKKNFNIYEIKKYIDVLPIEYQKEGLCTFFGELTDDEKNNIYLEYRHILEDDYDHELNIDEDVPSEYSLDEAMGEDMEFLKQLFGEDVELSTKKQKISYFIPENGFSINSISSEEDDGLRFVNIEEQREAIEEEYNSNQEQQNTQQTFLGRFVERIARIKKLTLDDITPSKKIDKTKEEGEQELE